MTNMRQNRTAGLTPPELFRLRKAWATEPEVRLANLAGRFRIGPKEAHRLCADLPRPTRSSFSQLCRGITAAVNSL